MTLKANQTPGRSEMSHGRGLVKEPRSDFQSQRNLVFPQGDDKTDLNTEYRASLRVDATVPDDNILPDMLYVEGNPDLFGPALPLVREEPVRPVGAHPQPKLRYGVDRQS
jgi:hypothetical protein